MKNVNKREELLKDIGLVKQQDNFDNQIPIVKIKNLSVNFNRGIKLYKAVKNISIDINKGDILGVVGESGSGKTTLGRSIIGLWNHDQGEVLLNGKKVPEKRIKSVTKKNIWVYKNSQMIFQDPTSSLNKQSKVLSIINEGMKNFNTIENEINEKLIEINENIEILKIKIKESLSLDFKKNNDKNKKEIDDKIKYLLEVDNKEFNLYVEEYFEYKKLNKELEEINSLIYNLPLNLKKTLKILKKSIKSDKFEIKESTQRDQDFFKNAINEQTKEFKKLIKSYESKPDIIEKRIKKRTSDFILYLIYILKNLTPNVKKEIDKILNKDIKLTKDNLENIKNYFEEWIDKNHNVDSSDINIIKNILLGIKIIIKKFESFVNITNTRSFNSLYKHIDNKVRTNINYYRELLITLEQRLIKEKNKLNNSKTNNDKKYNEISVKYLEDYKLILNSIIEEYRTLMLEYKEKLLTIDNDINKFGTYIYSKNKLFNSLYVSIITWKGVEKSKYEKRKSDKVLDELKTKKENIINKIEKIKNKFNLIENPIKYIEELFNISISNFENNEELLLSENDLILLNELEIFLCLDYIKLDQLLIELEKNEKSLLKINSKIIKKLNGKTFELLKNFVKLIKDKQYYENILINKKEFNEYKIKKIKDILNLVGLNEEAINKFPDQFSGGQKQRIGIARTIITNPKFIIADEPISALDVSVQAQVINLLKDLHEKLDLTMMFIAHDLQMVNYISNKIAVIYRGNVVEYGDSDKIYKTPIHPYTKSLINAIPSLKEIGKPLEVSSYKWSDHKYNEFSSIELREIEKNHFVYGTLEEIEFWKK